MPLVVASNRYMSMTRAQKTILLPSIKDKLTVMGWQTTSQAQLTPTRRAELFFRFTIAEKTYIKMRKKMPTKILVQSVDVLSTSSPIIKMDLRRRRILPLRLT